MRPELRTARARLASAEAAAKRTPSRDASERVDRLRTEFRTLALEDHIKRVVDDCPPLNDEQLARLAQLLRPSAGK